MKINAVFLPKSKLDFSIFSLKNYKKYFITAYLSLSVVAGIVIFSIKKDELADNFAISFAEYITTLLTCSKPKMFSILIKDTLPFIIILLLLSMSAIGNILIYLFSFVKFAGMGTYIAFLYSVYGIAGIKYSFLIFVPGKLIFIIGTLILIETCLKLSGDYRRKIRSSDSEIKSICIRLLIMMLLVILSVVIDLLTLLVFLPTTGIVSFF